MFVLYFIIVTVVLIKLIATITKGICTCKTRLDGKTVIITGANTGIGKETALDFAERGARVILACRNRTLAEKAKDDIIKKTGNRNVVVYMLDMASFDSVRQFSKEIHENESHLHILVNNAGVAGVGDQITKDGHNMVMQVNYFSQFLLTNLLLDLLKKSAPSRIITISSVLHLMAKLNLRNLDEIAMHKLTHGVVYGNSKLCTILMSKELARKLEGTNVTTNTLHPGVISTEIWRNLPIYSKMVVLLTKFFYKTPKEGAQTTIHVAVSEELNGVSGEYFQDCKKTWLLSPTAKNVKLRQRLWDETLKIVKLQPNEIHY
ncbi:retinol dehydrogenase 11-like [Chrysoperla carnea]|uniref:retinol dehydrogenase 11-like n=1 Tax=Chrysoperla carnea TaxID=189513 RepID=UPI001D088FAF|nr:retinol dehydrogenase 11-like [Chrysoperla carnea]